MEKRLSTWFGLSAALVLLLSYLFTRPSYRVIPGGVVLITGGCEFRVAVRGIAPEATHALGHTQRSHGRDRQ
jgi:hypothetical protein